MSTKKRRIKPSGLTNFFYHLTLRPFVPRLGFSQRGNRDYVNCSGVYPLPLGVLKFEKQARNRWELDLFCPSPWECFFKEKPITGDVPVYRAELFRRL